jgi:hypothetical protein
MELAFAAGGAVGGSGGDWAAIEATINIRVAKVNAKTFLIGYSF